MVFRKTESVLRVKSFVRISGKPNRSVRSLRNSGVLSGIRISQRYPEFYLKVGSFKHHVPEVIIFLCNIFSSARWGTGYQKMERGATLLMAHFQVFQPIVPSNLHPSKGAFHENSCLFLVQESGQNFETIFAAGIWKSEIPNRLPFLPIFHEIFVFIVCNPGDVIGSNKTGFSRTLLWRCFFSKK